MTEAEGKVILDAMADVALASNPLVGQLVEIHSDAVNREMRAREQLFAERYVHHEAHTLNRPCDRVTEIFGT